MDTTEPFETAIARQVQQIKSEFISSKRNIVKEDVDCFIQELTGYVEVLLMPSKTEACSEETNVLLEDITDLLQKLTQFKCDLKENREILSKIIDMEKQILQYQAFWSKLTFAEQSQETGIRIGISEIMKEIENMQNGTQYNHRLNALHKKCSQILQEIELTICKIENFNIQFFALQEQLKAILKTVKSSNDIETALLNLEEIKSHAENLQEISEESNGIKLDFIFSINRDIEKFTDILETDKKKFINSLQDFSAKWRQIEQDLNTITLNSDSLNQAETMLNEIQNSIDMSVKVLKGKTGNIKAEEQENVFQRKFIDIKKQVRAASNEDDGLQILQLANDLRKLQTQIIDHQSLLKEVQNYADVLEKEANNFSYLSGIEAKADEIDELFRKGVNIAEIQVELGRFQSMLDQNNFRTLLGRSEERRSNLVERVKNQVFRLEQLNTNARQDHINAEKLLLDLEKKLEIIDPQVRAFAGTKNGNHFFQLDEKIARYILQLDGIKIQNNEIQKRKVQLLKTLHELGDLMQYKAAAAESVYKLDTRIKDTLIFIQHTDRLTEKEQFRQIETTFQDLQKERELVWVTAELTDKIAECDQNLKLLETLILDVEEVKSCNLCD